MALTDTKICRARQLREFLYDFCDKFTDPDYHELKGHHQRRLVRDMASSLPAALSPTSSASPQKQSFPIGQWQKDLFPLAYPIDPASHLQLANFPNLELDPRGDFYQ